MRVIFSLVVRLAEGGVSCPLAGNVYQPCVRSRRIWRFCLRFSLRLAFLAAVVCGLRSPRLVFLLRTVVSFSGWLGLAAFSLRWGWPRGWPAAPREGGSLRLSPVVRALIGFRRLGVAVACVVRCVGGWLGCRKGGCVRGFVMCYFCGPNRRSGVRAPLGVLSPTV